MNRVSRIAVDLPDSSTLESIRQAEEVSRRIAMGLQNSQVLESIRQAEEVSRRIAMGLQNSQVLESIRQAEEVSRRIAMGLQNSQVLESIRQAEEVSRRIAMGLQNSQVLESIRQAEEVSRRIAMGLQNSQVLESIQAVVDSARLMSMGLQESPAMKAIREFSNTPFNPAVKEIVFNDLDALEIEQSDFPEDQDFAIDEDIELEIQKELEENCDYNSLSEKAQSLLLYIYHKYFLPIFLSCFASIITTNAQKVQISLQDKKTPAEIRSYVRKPIPEVNKELLKGHRVIIGSDVNLRKEPSMKSEVITKLPLGKLIEVLDKSNRSWLLIEVDIEEEVFVGWVSRRYTISLPLK